ncbi:MAG: TerB family tellurite resistance protein [Gammaproteobacteria bacterium]|jgi:uncharacterized tellurite resistance protein B-like protein
MIDRLKTVMQKLTQTDPSTQLSVDEIKMAAVALLVEVMMADNQIDENEKQQLLKSTMSLLQLTREESEELIDRAITKHKELVSLYDLTRVINLKFEQARKLELLDHMWRIAYSDCQWDKYEEHIIRKVADLLYISHKDFVHARVKAQELLSG